MKQNRRPQRKGRMNEEQRRLLPVVIIPLIVIILMIIIVVADHSKDKKATEPSAPTGTVSENPEQETMETAEGENSGNEETSPEETTVPAESEPTDEFETDTLKRDSVPEIRDLMKTYFKARSDADAETMNQLYGIGEVSETDLEAQKTRMRSNSKYVEGFENIATYVMNGTTGDAWLVYAIADIRFHSVKTTAPMIMWCYVKKDAEGNYQILDNASLSENVQQFIDVANHSEGVRRLASNINVKLKEALAADADLNSVYGVLRDGSPVWQDGDEEPEVIIDGGSGSSGETAADGETAGNESSADGGNAAGSEAAPEAGTLASPETAAANAGEAQVQIVQ
ncbi:hypothetical protein [Clostridium sp. AN503]|uniref:hypothetical protein n=1 Tax=Clostridium sp. AN503 TaxID=3160598 RepID=UPI0034597438